jgi:hypothetical protein
MLLVGNYPQRPEVGYSLVGLYEGDSPGYAMLGGIPAGKVWLWSYTPAAVSLLSLAVLIVNGPR